MHAQCFLGLAAEDERARERAQNLDPDDALLLAKRRERVAQQTCRRIAGEPRSPRRFLECAGRMRKLMRDPQRFRALRSLSENAGGLAPCTGLGERLAFSDQQAQAIALIESRRRLERFDRHTVVTSRLFIREQEAGVLGGCACVATAFARSPPGSAAQ